jgi:hypothetical protein
MDTFFIVVLILACIFIVVVFSLIMYVDGFNTDKASTFTGTYGPRGYGIATQYAL